LLSRLRHCCKTTGLTNWSQRWLYWSQRCSQALAEVYTETVLPMMIHIRHDL